VRRRVPVVEGDDDLAVVPLLGVEDRLALRLVGRQRLLGHHIDAAVEPLDDVLVMKAVDRRHHQEVGLRLVDHLVERRERRTRDADEVAGDAGALRIDVVEADEVEQVGITLDEIAAPHAAAAVAGADDRVAPLGDRLREGVRRKERGADRGASGGDDEVAAAGGRQFGHGRAPLWHDRGL